MTSTRRRWGRKTALASAGVMLAVVAGTLTAPARADVTAKAPVATVPGSGTAELGSGRHGRRGALRSWSGSTPMPFKVDVLGVLDDGVGVGRDMIMIKVSDYAGQHVIDQGDGIWAGMSGSPVYVGGKLLGAVAWGFTSSPSAIGGLTPAEDMLDVLGADHDTGQGEEPTAGGRQGQAARRRQARSGGQGRCPDSPGLHATTGDSAGRQRRRSQSDQPAAEERRFRGPGGAGVRGRPARRTEGRRCSRRPADPRREFRGRACRTATSPWPAPGRPPPSAATKHSRSDIRSRSPGR